MGRHVAESHARWHDRDEVGGTAHVEHLEVKGGVLEVPGHERVGGQLELPEAHVSFVIRQLEEHSVQVILPDGWQFRGALFVRDSCRLRCLAGSGSA